MVSKDYIVYITYNYNDDTQIIKYDTVLLELIESLPYKKKFFFFSQLEGKRFLKLEIFHPYIYKLVKILQFPFVIDTILRVINLNDTMNHYDDDFFYSIDTNLITNSPTYNLEMKNLTGDCIHDVETKTQKKDEWVRNKLTVPTKELENELEDYQDSEPISKSKIIRIFGNSYPDTLPLNKLHLDDLSIVISINTNYSHNPINNPILNTSTKTNTSTNIDTLINR